MLINTIDITEKWYRELCSAGLGAFANCIGDWHGDESYRGNSDAVYAYQRMPEGHKEFLNKSQVARDAVHKAYSDSTRGSDGGMVLIQAISDQYAMWQDVQKLIHTLKPSVQMAELLLEVVKASAATGS